MVKRRRRDLWAECTSAALHELGVLTLPQRCPGQKQPKPQAPEELLRVTYSHLEKIVERYDTMENLERILLEPSEGIVE